MKYLMGIDNGGTFSKAAIFDQDGNQISVAAKNTSIVTPKPGYTERDLTGLWEANAYVIKKAIENADIDKNDIVGVSFSGHGKGLYMIKEDGTPSYNGIISTDTRAWEYVQRWNLNKVSEKVYEKTYQKILACQPVSLLAWFKDNRPDVLENTRWIFAVKDYIRFKLTGKAYAEYTDFSGANLLNLDTGNYDEDLLSLFGLEDIYEKLPELKHSTDICGYVTEKASRETGLPEGIPVAAGMFDINACAIASGLNDTEKLCMIAGTWSINEYIRNEPIKNKTVDLNSMFCIPGYFLIEESSPTSAGNMQWFIKKLLSFEEKEYENKSGSIYDYTNSVVESIEPDECNVIFLPFLNGSNENPLAKGSFIGMSAYHGKEHMLRAVYEGVVFSHLTHLKKLLKNRSTPSSIQLSGGAANSDVWVQIFADATGIPIDVIESKEIGAHGASIVAGIAAGIYKDYDDAIKRTVRITKTVYPRKKYQKIYKEKYETYKMVIESLNSVWNRFKN